MVKQSSNVSKVKIFSGCGGEHVRISCQLRERCWNFPGVINRATLLLACNIRDRCSHQVILSLHCKSRDTFVFKLNRLINSTLALLTCNFVETVYLLQAISKFDFCLVSQHLPVILFARVHQCIVFNSICHHCLVPRHVERLQKWLS